ncbi:hypothetical protein H0H81_004428 [Sphagnurus paluster]|uniref:Cytochrome P450 n=1 Tax=Sphagnurus paluster TaxID=117069 RepID=A0A9P7GSZ3_9AGAR|nr:hypothetical protein H0H81_004428 [Sphagnurus paluster]
MNKKRLADVLPALFDDVQARMEGWGKEGRMDPFKNIYDVRFICTRQVVFNLLKPRESSQLVFQMTVRMGTCRELSSNMDDLSPLQAEYWKLEKSATPTSLLLPWLPSQAKKDKETATKSLFTVLQKYVDKRRAAEVPTADAIDLLIAEGLSTELIIKEWKEKIMAEVDTLVQTHTDTLSDEPLHKRLAAIPISVWEDEMPVLDTVIRETIRLVVNGTVLRRNLVEEIPVSSKIVPKGHFVAYQLSDVHLNPDIYTQPTEFDPTRFGLGREEDKKQTFAYLGWGAGKAPHRFILAARSGLTLRLLAAGRHPCTGMKVAKLEIKIIVALFLAGYEYDIVNEAGEFPGRLPKPNYNDIYQVCLKFWQGLWAHLPVVSQARPLGEPCFIQFKRVVE